ncbi:hypothetical protein [Mycolicibacterium sp.]|uniref:hypothetical protein n=1 Tax=Mycolicibacterium sp. TaxID=2320850 RepID=UPI00355CD823
MAYTYKLFVDADEKFSGTFPDAARLAYDAVFRATTFGQHEATAGELADDIDRGFTSIDLRAAAPAITVQVVQS